MIHGIRKNITTYRMAGTETVTRNSGSPNPNGFTDDTTSTKMSQQAVAAIHTPKNPLGGAFMGVRISR